MSSRGPGRPDTRDPYGSAKIERRFNVPETAIVQDIAPLLVAKDIEVEATDIIRTLWEEWVDEINKEFPSIRPLLGVLVPQEELNSTIEGIHASALAAIGGARSLFSYAKTDPRAAKNAEKIVRDRLRSDFKTYLSHITSKFKSHSDPQTKLLTGPVAEAYLEKLILAHKIPTAVFTSDIKGLRALNTGLGQLLTDKVIETVFKRISTCLRDSDVFFRRRAGGDEAVGVLPGVTNFEELGIVMKRLIGILDKDITLDLSNQETKTILKKYIALRDEVEKGVDVQEKTPGAISVLEEILPSLANELGGSSRDPLDPVTVSLKINMRFGALLLETRNMSKGFSPYARFVLEGLEECAKALEGSHSCPAVVYNVKDNSGALFSKETIEHARIERDRIRALPAPAPHLPGELALNKTTVELVKPPTNDWEDYPSLDPETLYAALNNSPLNNDNGGEDDIHSLLEKAMALLPAPKPAE